MTQCARAKHFLDIYPRESFLCVSVKRKTDLRFNKNNFVQIINVVTFVGRGLFLIPGGCTYF